MQKIRFFISLSALVYMAGCSPTPADDQTLDGPVDGLTGQEMQQFLRGDDAFNNKVFTSNTGLGPLFVATSCGSCHAGDGKGHPTTTLVRFGQYDSTGNQYLGQGGPQLQHRAIPGYIPEVIPAGATFSRFTPPANTGLGLLEAVPDAVLLALADPNDADGDGISGRPNWINLPSYVIPRSGSVVQDNKYIGRMGKKAAVYDLLQQTANAFNQDMGITSVYETKDTYSGQHIDPEVPTQTVLDIVFYLQTLKAPVPRNQGDAQTMSGKNIFTQINCSKCHIPQLQTGDFPVSALAYKTIYPYTDLLLHDMGAALNDGYTEGTALASEWRTPPLWGLGLSPNSQGGQYYLLHDGRAGSIEEAILLHDGEAAGSRNAYTLLTQQEKENLIRFLEGL